MTGWELVGGGSGVLVVVGLFAGALRRKQNVPSCKREHEHVDGKFKSGNERFNKLERADIDIAGQLRKQGEALARMEGTLIGIAKANGISHDGN